MHSALHEYPPFPGIRPEGLSFLEDLRDDAHQDRDWFNARKHLYTDELRWPMRCLVADVARRLEGSSTVSLHGDPRKSVFRIYRDVRFSNDKRPYQSHVACKLTVDPGFKDDEGLVYVHVQPPDQSFIAAGIYGPPVKRLRPIRNRIVHEPHAWSEVLQRLADEGLEVRSHGDDLKGMPRGFTDYSDHEAAPYLKWTSFLVTEHVSLSDVQSTSFADIVTSFAARSWPLLRFISETT